MDTTGYHWLTSIVFESLNWKHSNLGASEVGQLFQEFTEQIERLRALQGIELEFQWSDEHKNFTSKYQ